MATGQVFTVIFDKVSVSAVQDLFEINAPSNAMLKIHEIVISQAGTASQQLHFKVHRGTSSGGGAAATPRPHRGSATFGGSVKVNSTSMSTIGDILRVEYGNTLSGWQWLATPEIQLEVPPSGRLNVTLEVAPTSAVNMSGVLVFEVSGS